ncbi:uncharacterized protein LOC124696861 isoform X2 [Lolium rigidum]|uniref:uncharacterized protein LOC124696861 isoform X2 n=1 Tax=Lolium rigidum TaxID=89674 RepID=UPI001F5DFEC7|nr:uncharacterized protein LOC124696861 isoform X2 [Lolium rigidum]
MHCSYMLQGLTSYPLLAQVFLLQHLIRDLLLSEELMIQHMIHCRIILLLAKTAFAQLSLNQSGSGTEEVAPYELMQQMVPLQELEQNNHDQPGSLASPNLVICHSDMPVATVLQGNGSPRSSGTSSATPLATQASHHGTSVCSVEDAHAPSDTTVFTIPPQVLHKHPRGHGQAVVEDRDKEKEVHQEFNIELKKCGAHQIICMMCFLSGYHKKNKTKLKKMRKEELKDHCKSFHGASGIKCAKKGCQVRARNQGDIGAHELYCHGI